LPVPADPVKKKYGYLENSRCPQLFVIILYILYWSAENFIDENFVEKIG